ncbi:hypothetical protein EV127DRAFT_409317 [Xylaria flabelliformis]|nr:hypothetical protein EV127DRAFT_409317 [Xylaria flabelliformis]
MPVDPMLYSDQSISPDSRETFQCYGHNNSLNRPVEVFMSGQAGCSRVEDSGFMAPFDYSKTRTVDPILQQSLRPLALSNLRGMDMTTIMDNSFPASTFQSQSSMVNIPQLDEDYTMSFLPAPSNAASLLPILNEPSGENTSGTEIKSNKRPRTRSDKVEKVFACYFSHCSFTACSRKDVRRHMRADKHQKDQGPKLPRFYCEVLGCLKDKGFSRRDNMLRHMSRVHKVELKREKPGRKRREKG